MDDRRDDPHRVLGVAIDACAADIDAAYAALALQHHPDMGGDERRFCEIQAAHAALQDASRASQAPVRRTLGEGERESKTLTLQHPDGSVQRQQIWLRGRKDGVSMLLTSSSSS